jgi:hypothetical protein
MEPAAVSCTFPCEICERVAATVSLLPPGASDALILRDMWHLTIAGGPVPMSVGPVREQEDVAAALQAGDAAALARFDREYANFRCPSCEACYCVDHWSDVIPEMDEGFYDATWGTCPRGHRVMLDD